MKLEITRGLFLVGALGIASLALTVWEQPGPKILGAEIGAGHCPVPRVAKVEQVVKPSHDLLLFMFGMTQ
ncbi:hypothetical protein [Pseudomonas sp.]|uniref:hypothetical protein n=1 Tax=Pseudomonas sp. TaxID=306 RepID=UPI00263379CF|nr:hypothetical protein [Pseudomonas sp.]